MSTAKEGRLRELALFAGAGGGILGGHLLGWRTVCAVEIEDYPRRVLLARQRDGMLPRFPIWDDIRTFDGNPWRGRVDVISGGFPCQDISAAGKGAGITGARSGLWTHMARIIGEVRPRYCFVENSPLLVSRGLDVVLGDLAALGYDAAWGVVGAHHVRAPHKRDRIWIFARNSYRNNVATIVEIRGGSHPKPGGVCPHVGNAMCADGERGAGSVPGAETAECGSRQFDGDQPDGFEYAGQGSGAGYVADTECQRQQAARNRQIDGQTPGNRQANQSGDGGKVLAHANSFREPQSEVCVKKQRGRAFYGGEGDFTGGVRTDYRGGWWQSEPHLGGMVDGLAPGLDLHGAHAAGDVGRVAKSVPNRSKRLKATGNGQVSICAATAWVILNEVLDNHTPYAKRDSMGVTA